MASPDKSKKQKHNNIGLSKAKKECTTPRSHKGKKKKKKTSVEIKHNKTILGIHREYQ